MKNSKLLLLLVVATGVIFVTSCKVDEIKPAIVVEFGNAEIQLNLFANLNTANDTNINGNQQIKLEKIQGMSVSIITNRSSFYKTSLGDYKDEVITGTSDANGVVTLNAPVGEMNYVNYSVVVHDKMVKETYIGQDGKVSTRDRIASGSTTDITVTKDGKIIRDLEIKLK